MKTNIFELDTLQSNPRKTIEFSKYERIFNDGYNINSALPKCTLFVRSTGYVPYGAESFTFNKTGESFTLCIANENGNSDITRTVIEFSFDASEISPSLIGYVYLVNNNNGYNVILSSKASYTGDGTSAQLFSYVYSESATNLTANIVPFAWSTLCGEKSLLYRVPTLKSDTDTLKGTVSSIQSQINTLKNQLYPVGIVQWIKSGSTPTGIGLPGSWTSLDPICIATNANTSVGLDVTGAQFKDGTNVELWTLSGEAQKWRIRSASGTFLVPWLRTA